MTDSAQRAAERIAAEFWDDSVAIFRPGVKGREFIAEIIRAECFPVVAERMFPLQAGYSRDARPGPLSIPWSIAEKAYGVYAARHGRSQSLERLAERGGFGTNEMDDLYPPWRGEVDEIVKLRSKVAELESVLAKVRRRCAEILKGESYSIFQKQFAESILNESEPNEV